jgi:DNA-binding NarL/FixJ family response regulator
MLKVAIFEDNRHLRESMALIINNTDGMACSGAFANGLNLVKDIMNSNPDIVLMDLDMPGLDGIECTKIISKQFPLVKVLIQTVFNENKKIEQAIKAGAQGYILKKARPQDLIEAIYELMNDGAPMSPEIAKKVLSLLKSGNLPQPNAEHGLTDREIEILKALVDGDSYKEIAQKLFISFFTVQSHIKNIYQKLDVNSKSEAVGKVLKDRII